MTFSCQQKLRSSILLWNWYTKAQNPVKGSDALITVAGNQNAAVYGFQVFSVSFSSFCSSSALLLLNSVFFLFPRLLQDQKSMQKIERGSRLRCSESLAILSRCLRLLLRQRHQLRSWEKPGANFCISRPVHLPQAPTVRLSRKTGGMLPHSFQTSEVTLPML